jgi:putative NADH-flavin reductase
MKVAIFGATGMIGGAIAQEALQRHHHVTAIVRDPVRLAMSNANLEVVTGDIFEGDEVLDAIQRKDAVIASISGRRDGNPEVIVEGAKALLEVFPQSGARRLIWIGGAGTLESPSGGRVMDAPDFPAEWKPEAEAQAEALEVFRSSGSNVDWTYVSPPAVIAPGKRTGHYRLGGDQLLTDERGESRISVADFAVAVIDILERPEGIRKRITVAY